MSYPKILIVDFEKKSIDFLLDCLKGEKYRTVTAADGQEGLDKFESEKPDLVILEAMLPKIHGFDLCKKIASNGSNKVPVVITTGFYRGEYYKTEAVRSFGASAFLEKPYKKQELLFTVHNLLKNGGDVVAKTEKKPQIDISPLPPTPPKEKSNVDVSRKVDEMLKATLNEFGLSSSERKKVGVPDIPEKNKKAEKKRLKEKEPAEGKKISVAEKKEKEIQTKKEEVKEIPKEKKVESRKAEENEPGDEKKDIEIQVDKAETGDSSEKEIKMPEQETEVEDRVIEEEKTSFSTIALKCLEQVKKIPTKSALEKCRKAIQRTRLKIVAPAAVAALGILTTGYYILKPKEGATHPQGKEELALSTVQRGMSFNPIVDPLSPDMMSIAAAEEGFTEIFEIPPGESVDESAAEEIAPASKPSGGLENDKSNEGTVQEVIPPLEMDAPPSSELVMIEPLLDKSEADLFTSSSLQDQEDSESKAGKIPLDDISLPNPESLPEQNKPLPEEKVEEKTPPVSNPEKKEIKHGDLVPIDLVDTQPVAVEKVNPRYPSQALSRGVEDTVILKALISEEGDVLETQVIQVNNSLFGFDKASEQAVVKWKFKPATKDGVKVKVWKVIAFNFKKQ